MVQEGGLSVLLYCSLRCTDLVRAESRPQHAWRCVAFRIPPEPSTTTELTLRTLPGKLNRGISVVDTVEILKGEALSEAEYTRAAILGWCIELVSAERLEGTHS